MVDFNLDITAATPINIKEMELNQYSISPHIRRSIILYNKAVSEIRTKEYALAITDLNRSLSYNGSLSEAMKLLGLCYANMKKYRKAKKVFKKLAEYDIYKDLAEQYIESIKIEKAVDKTMKVMGKANIKGNAKSKQGASPKFTFKKFIIGFSIILIASAGIAAAHYAPALFFQKHTEDSEVALNTTMDKENIETNYEQNTAATAGNNTSAENYESSGKEPDKIKVETKTDNDRQDLTARLNDAEKALNSSHFEEAASTLLSMKDMSLDNDSKAKFDALIQKLKQTGLWTIYNQGNNLYKQGKYAEALPKIKLTSELDPTLDIMPWITYQIAMCYKEIGNKTEALVIFQKLKETYPKSIYASYSDSKIKQMNN